MGDHPEAGNHIFVAGWDSKLYRYSGLNSVWEHDGTCDVVEGVTRTQIMATGAVVTGVAVDVNDPNHVIATVGGYGVVSGGKVQETFNALDEDPRLEQHLVPEQQRPQQDAGVRRHHRPGDPTGNTILVGTEHGVWQTIDGGENWTVENLGMVAAATTCRRPGVLHGAAVAHAHRVVAGHEQRRHLRRHAWPRHLPQRHVPRQRRMTFDEAVAPATCWCTRTRPKARM